MESKRKAKTAAIDQVHLAVMGCVIPWIAIAGLNGHWSYEFAESLAAGVMGSLAFSRLASQRSPFQFVLRLADDDVGDGGDGQMFDKLHERFKRECRDKSVQFDGFDIGDGWPWFYFKGTDAGVVREKVMALLWDYPSRHESYFQVRGDEQEPLLQIRKAENAHQPSTS